MIYIYANKILKVKDGINMQLEQCTYGRAL
jgi:hypothetical protein